MDKARKNLRSFKNRRDFRESYGKKVAKYNQRVSNRLYSESIVTIDDLQDIAFMVHSLQKYYSVVFRDLVGDNPDMFDMIYKGSVSIKDVVRFAIMDSYESLLQKGLIGSNSIGDMKTFNAKIHADDMYEEYVELFDKLREDEEERIETMSTNRDIRNLHRDFVPTDDIMRNIFYGVQGGPNV